MQAALDASVLSSQAVALELHALLKDIDPARWRDETASAMQERLEHIIEELTALMERTWEEDHAVALREQLHTIRALLESHAPDSSDVRTSWMELRASLHPAYESLAAALRDESAHVPSLRPTNYLRNVFHVGNAIWVIGLVEYVLLGPWLFRVALGGAIWAWSMEISRRASPRINTFLMSVFNKVAHPHEAHRINSATWYATALVILAVCFDVWAGVAGLAILGLGDPFAAIVGRRFGRTKLINGRTLEGTLAFIVMGTLGAALALGLFHPDVTHLPLVCVVAATFGGVAELLTKRVDDNLAIPVAAALGATLTALI